MAKVLLDETHYSEVMYAFDTTNLPSEQKTHQEGLGYRIKTQQHR